MKELQFIASREAEWAKWAIYLDPALKPAATYKTDKATPVFRADELAPAFRRLAGDLALAKDRHYSSSLQDRLQQLMLTAHQRIYGARRGEGNAVLHFLLRGLPQAVRREWRVVSLGAALFFGPLLFMIVLLQWLPEAVYWFIPSNQVSNFEYMYSPDAQRLGRMDAGDDWMMWGHYIANNIQIDLQCFATGLFFGIGTLFYTLFNGFFIGAVAGHLTHLGYIETFWGFVAGHSAFELTGVVLSSAAGLKMGYALIAPGNFSRGAALKQAILAALPLIWGAVLLTFLAAFVEGFWSPLRSLPIHLKYGVGITLWLLTWAYLLLAGRGRHAA